MAWGNPVEKMFLVKRNVNLRKPTGDLREGGIVEVREAWSKSLVVAKGVRLYAHVSKKNIL